MVVKYCRCLTSPLPLRLALPLVIFLFSVTGFSGHMLPHQQQIPSFEFPGQNPSKHCFPSCFREKKPMLQGSGAFCQEHLELLLLINLASVPGERLRQCLPFRGWSPSLRRHPCSLSQCLAAVRLPHSAISKKMLFLALLVNSTMYEISFYPTSFNTQNTRATSLMSAARRALSAETYGLRGPALSLFLTYYVLKASLYTVFMHCTLPPRPY